MTTTSRTPRRGLTLVELLFALSLTTAVLVGVVQASRSGLALLRRNAVESDVTTRSGRALQRIVRELLAAGEGTLVPDLRPPLVGPDPGNAQVDFRSGEDFQSDAMQWSTPLRLTWERDANELDNDLDDDGDGLVDEGGVVLVRKFGQADQERRVLVHDVPELLEGEAPNGADDNGNGLFDEPGFCLTRSDDRVVVRLTLQRPGPDGRPVTRTRTTSVRLRN